MKPELMFKYTLTLVLKVCLQFTHPSQQQVCTAKHELKVGNLERGRPRGDWEMRPVASKQEYSADIYIQKLKLALFSFEWEKNFEYSKNQLTKREKIAFFKILTMEFFNKHKGLITLKHLIKDHGLFKMWNPFFCWNELKVTLWSRPASDEERIPVDSDRPAHSIELDRSRNPRLSVLLLFSRGTCPPRLQPKRQEKKPNNSYNYFRKFKQILPAG